MKNSFFVWMIWKENPYTQIKIFTIRLWELQSDLSLEDPASSTEGITQSSVNYLL